MFKKIIFLAVAVLGVVLCGTATALADDVMPEGAPEPIIRVGLAKTAAPVVVTASTSFGVWFGGIERISLAAGDSASVRYGNGLYTVTAGGTSVTVGEPIRFAAVDPGEPLTITSLNRRLAGHGGRAYNKYRGVVEYRFSPLSQIPYIINELPLESYLAGLVESAPGDPEEFVKAVVVAGRTYAYAHISFAPPTNKHVFDVYGSTQDQLYLGFESEARLPTVAVAAQATRGQMVLYNNTPVLTLYFSHSNGATKTWPKKLGARPWLTSVVAVYDKGKRLSGHGYGMSLSDARLRALKDGWTYDQLLTYYYSSTTVAQVYQ